MMTIKESIVWTKLWPCRRVSASAKVASLIPRGDLFNSTWQHHCHLLWPHHNPNSQSSLPYSFKVHLDVIWRGNCHKIEIDMFEFQFSKKKKKIGTLFFLSFFNHLNEGGGLQPSQPFLWSGYGDFQRKRKSHGAHIWLLSTSPMTKMDWPTHL